jgi:peptide/nickel transport system substrate-binding protein
MKRNVNRLIFFLVLLIFLPYCQREPFDKSNTIVVAIQNDIETTNPLYAVNLNDGAISNILYPGLLEGKWNYKTGDVDYCPKLAKSWQWNSDSTSITILLHKNAFWVDGKPITAKDVVFTFDLYSDPLVQSRYYGQFKNFYTDTVQHIILSKSFEVINPYELIIHFKKNTVPNYFDISYPILPEHIYKNVDRKNLVSAEKDIKPVGCGPYTLDKWEKNQAIILKANKKSIFYKKGSADELIFKIVPDYNSRLAQLKSGEVDFVPEIKADDLPDLLKNKFLTYSVVKGRDYDYVAWNNIDPVVYSEQRRIVPNKLFSDVLVRKALTYAINRKAILEGFLNNNGQLATGPVSPVFSEAIDTSLTPLPYDPSKAKTLLAQAGWKNIGGTLTKNGIKFSFTLYYPSGNPLRTFAASIIKNNLSQIGIDVKTEALEPGVFFNKMYQREFNAWMAGWSVALPLDLKPLWYSSVPGGEFNLVTYQNKKLDNLLDEIETTKSNKLKNINYKKIQQILYNDNPTTFLYWTNIIVVYNKRIHNVNITPTGALDNCWNWTIGKKYNQ